MSTPSLSTISLLTIEVNGKLLVSDKDTKPYGGNSDIKKSTEKTLCCKIKWVLACFVTVAMYVGIGMLWAMKHYGTTSLLVLLGIGTGYGVGMLVTFLFIIFIFYKCGFFGRSVS